MQLRTWSFKSANHKKIGSAYYKSKCNNFRNKLLVRKFAVLLLRNIFADCPPLSLLTVSVSTVYRLLKYILCSHEDRLFFWMFLTFKERSARIYSPSFHENKPKTLVSVIQNECFGFGLVIAKTGSIISGTEIRQLM
jgi:hypothetical protein